MEQWKRDARNEVIMVDLEALVPKDHLLRKIENVMDQHYIELLPALQQSLLSFVRQHDFLCILIRNVLPSHALLG